MIDFDPIITHTFDQKRYESKIDLINIDFTFVGFYYCVKNASKNNDYSNLVKNKQASQIYLFVYGKLIVIDNCYWVAKIVH